MLLGLSGGTITTGRVASSSVALLPHPVLGVVSSRAAPDGLASIFLRSFPVWGGPVRRVRVAKQCAIFRVSIFESGIEKGVEAPFDEAAIVFCPLGYVSGTYADGISVFALGFEVVFA
jgi:hypothetical protein